MDDPIVAAAMEQAEREATGITDSVGIVGYGVAVVRGPNGEVKQAIPFANLVTDKGDEYYAKKAIVGISPANPSAPTAANGMKLGTGTTTPTKSSTAAALITYISGSNQAFDTSYPQASAVGTDLGWYATYQSFWDAGDVTNSAITEAVIVNDSATDATSTAANTYSRVVFTAANKTADDSLTITWRHKFLGAS